YGHEVLEPSVGHVGTGRLLGVRDRPGREASRMVRDFSTFGGYRGCRLVRVAPRDPVHSPSRQRAFEMAVVRAGDGARAPRSPLRGARQIAGAHFTKHRYSSDTPPTPGARGS